MEYLIPFFFFAFVITVVLVISTIVRPQLPEFFQPIFTVGVMGLCLLIFLGMGISSIWTAVKGAFYMAFGGM